MVGQVGEAGGLSGANASPASKGAAAGPVVPGTRVAGQLFGDAFDNSPDAMMVVDAQNTVVAFNRASEQLTGWRADEAVGQCCREVYCCGDGETRNHANCRRRVDLRHTPLCSPADRDEYQILVATKPAAQEKWRPVNTDVLEAVAHEIFGPLNTIRGYATTVLQLDDALAPAQRRRYLRGIETCTARATQLARSILDLPHLEADRLSLSLEQASLPSVVRRVVSEMQSCSTDHLIRLRMPRSVPRIRIDRQRIEQVVNNVLGNAIKYSPRGGEIQVSVDEIFSAEELVAIRGIAPPEAPPCLIVSVRDSGTGIHEDELELVFEKFYRADSELSSATSGIGIGLYISKVIVEAHGGHIWATSKSGIGSTFSFSLPLARPIVAGK